MDERSVSVILKAWEDRDRSWLEIRVRDAWKRGRRPAARILLISTLAILAAAAAIAREDARDAASLAERLERTRQTLIARQGEVTNLHLELERLQTIIARSAEHRIPADLAIAIHDIARQEGIEPAVAFSLVREESSFTRGAVSPVGAVGYTQVMPSTAFWMDPGLRREDLFDRDTNLRLGFRYLQMMVQQYDGDLRLALLAYNRGPGRVDAIVSAGGDPGNGYDRAVLRGLGYE
jgi:soluble lytic murein transglycosylase-like protein